MSEFLPAQPHGTFREVFPSVFLVTGSFRVARGICIARNMTIVRQGDELTLINSVRLTQEGERELEKLGRPAHLLRIGIAHGTDDPYFVHRYRTKLWAPPNMRHYGELETDEELRDQATPIEQSRTFLFSRGRAPEAALILRGGILVTCDSYQYWEGYEHCSLLAKGLLFAGGFAGPHIGKPWVERMGPAIREDFNRLAAEEFSHLVAGHGTVLRDRASDGLRQAIAKRFGRRA
jgi:hypothetical protein